LLLDERKLLFLKNQLVLLLIRAPLFLISYFLVAQTVYTVLVLLQSRVVLIYSYTLVFHHTALLLSDRKILDNFLLLFSYISIVSLIVLKLRLNLLNNLLNLLFLMHRIDIEVMLQVLFFSSF